MATTQNSIWSIQGGGIMVMPVPNFTVGEGRPGLRAANHRERLRILYEVYTHLNEKAKAAGKRVTYSTVHQTIQRLQPLLQRSGLELGYQFAERNFYGPWDSQLQHDLIILDAHGLVDNHDEAEDVTTHRLGPTRLGEARAAALDWAEGDQYMLGQTRRQFRIFLETDMATPEGLV